MAFWILSFIIKVYRTTIISCLMSIKMLQSEENHIQLVLNIKKKRKNYSIVRELFSIRDIPFTNIQWSLSDYFVPKLKIVVWPFDCTRTNEYIVSFTIVILNNNTNFLEPIKSENQFHAARVIQSRQIFNCSLYLSITIERGGHLFVLNAHTMSILLIVV